MMRSLLVVHSFILILLLTLDVSYVAASDNNILNAVGAGSSETINNSSTNETSIAETVSAPPVMDPTPSPTLLPTLTPRFSPTTEWDTTTSVDILVAALFLIAAGWLVLAIIYSLLILIVIRMRSRGELDIYDENFGRLFLFGDRCYIPLGCFLRRHVLAINRRDQTVRLMNRGERRSAMEILLTEARDNQTSNDEAASRNETMIRGEQNQNSLSPIDDGDSNGEPICSICLMEYGKF